MKTATMLLACAAALWMTPAFAAPGGDAEQEVLALERQTMDGWLKGDPEPLLAISDPQITYFHVMTGGRIEGLPALKKLYDQYRGTPLFDRYEILNPKTQVAGDIVVLTYQLAQYRGAAVSYWNATQVYQKKAAGWRVAHTHWSQAKEQ